MDKRENRENKALFDLPAVQQAVEKTLGLLRGRL